jgi:hypothetical protein
MFNIPLETLAYWQKRDFQRAQASEIEAVNAIAGGQLPNDYKTFLANYGFVFWEYTVPDTFDYRIDDDGQVVVSDMSITYLHDAGSLNRLIPGIWRDEPQNGLPMIPRHVFPVGGRLARI